jgi:hypothetical protein
VAGRNGNLSLPWHHSSPPPIPWQYNGPPGSLEDTLCLTFSLEVERFGQRQFVELMPNGENVPVNEYNRLE